MSSRWFSALAILTRLVLDSIVCPSGRARLISPTGSRDPLGSFYGDLVELQNGSDSITSAMRHRSQPRTPYTNSAVAVCFLQGGGLRDTFCSFRMNQMTAELRNHRFSGWALRA